MSAWLEVGSGDPQGFVLGPKLFVMYINDLPEMISRTTHVFADNTVVFWLAVFTLINC